MHGFTEKIYENSRMVCEANVMYKRLFVIYHLRRMTCRRNFCLKHALYPELALKNSKIFHLNIAIFYIFKEGVVPVVSECLLHCNLKRQFMYSVPC